MWLKNVEKKLYCATTRRSFSSCTIRQYSSCCRDIFSVKLLRLCWTEHENIFVREHRKKKTGSERAHVVITSIISWNIDPDQPATPLMVLQAAQNRIVQRISSDKNAVLLCCGMILYKWPFSKYHTRGTNYKQTFQ